MRKFFENNLANLVTTFGLIATIWLLIIVITNPEQLWLVIFLSGMVGLSDLMDGWIARRLKIESTIGGVLDRLRDKIFICPILIILAQYWPTVKSGILSALTKALIILIILNEILLILMGIIGLINGLDVSSNPYGRRKMFCQFTDVYLWLLSLAAEKYLAIHVFSFSVYLINLILLLAAYLGIKSLEGHYQRYKTKELKF